MAELATEWHMLPFQQNGRVCRFISTSRLEVIRVCWFISTRGFEVITRVLYIHWYLTVLIGCALTLEAYCAVLNVYWILKL